MNKLNISEDAIKILEKKLFEFGHLCIIGGSKCGKSRLALEIVEHIGKTYPIENKKTESLIPGVSNELYFYCDRLDFPIVILKDVSGMTLLDLEKIVKNNFVISTFPVLSLDLLYNRFIAFNPDYKDVNKFTNRLWKCIPVIVENKKLGDGNIYMMSLYSTNYNASIINKKSICKFVQERVLFEEEFSRVKGKYVFYPDIDRK